MNYPGRAEVLREQTSQGESQDGTHGPSRENKSKLGQEDKVQLREVSWKEHLTDEEYEKE